MDKEKCGIYTQWSSIQPKKKKESLIFVTTWMNLEGIIISETSQTEKTKTVRRKVLFILGINKERETM